MLAKVEDSVEISLRVEVSLAVTSVELDSPGTTGSLDVVDSVVPTVSLVVDSPVEIEESRLEEEGLPSDVDESSLVEVGSSSLVEVD